MNPVFAPPTHRPVEVCAHCGDGWPCGAERSMVAAREAARVAVKSSVDAALLVAQTRDVPSAVPAAGEPGSSVLAASGSINQSIKEG